MRRPRLILALLLGSCGSVPPDPDGLRAEVSALLPQPLELALARGSIARLGWHAANEACPHVYDIEVKHDVVPSGEADGHSFMVIGPHVNDGQAPAHRGQPLQPGEIDILYTFLRGSRFGPSGGGRDTYLSSTFIGPSAPTVACYVRTWDPIEDALGLGWARLSGRLTAIGEAWVGNRVEARCNQSACVDPEGTRRGARGNLPPCTTPSWRESLSGIVEIDGQAFAYLESEWSDGHGEKGIRTARQSLLSIEHGRPAVTRVVVQRAFLEPVPQENGGIELLPVTRTWTMTAIDDCPGSLAAAGWQRPEGVAAIAEQMVEDWQQRRRPSMQPPAADAPEPANAREAETDTNAPVVTSDSD